MTEKNVVNFQEKYKNGIFQILKICEMFTKFGFNLTVRKKNTLNSVIVWK